MKKALIVVDYQKDFVDGALGFEKAVQLEQAICRKIEQAREQGEQILFTFDTNTKSINAISLLRDTMINTSASRGAQKRLNAVYSRNRGSSELP